MELMRSNPHEAVSRDAKASRLASAVLAAVPGLAAAEVDNVLASAAVRRAAEAATKAPAPASEQTWGLVAGKIRQRLGGGQR
jgi:hypothetical protein